MNGLCVIKYNFSGTTVYIYYFTRNACTYIIIIIVNILYYANVQLVDVFVRARLFRELQIFEKRIDRVFTQLITS